MYQLRKCLKFTSYQATKTITLDPEKFRNLSIPYEGNSEEEFLKYIDENSYDLEDIYEEMDEETSSQMEGIWQPEYEEYSNTSWNFEDSWIEIGKENTDLRNGFEVNHDTYRE